MPVRTRLAAAALGATAVAALPATVVATSYVVRPGDTLGDIAIRHGTTVRALTEANELASGDLRAGQLLQIPDATLMLPVYTRGSVDVEAYRVHAGEGVFEIARRFGVDATALARANGIGVSAPLAEGAELQIPGRLARMNALLTFVAGEVQVDPRLVRAVAWVESGWRQDAVSATGAVGIMQLEPFTGDWVSRHLAQRRLDIWVAQDNVLAGSLLLQHLWNTHDGDPAATLAGYYQGDASVAGNGLFGDTRRYQERVGSLMSQEA
ncbi:MAG: LysM peptidoglycan-binding domain-containing protein [Candidatus Dormibacteraeota bacterium]|nr:LysM peptidoglycan-binding domain-containing protein [Candidatus Dormibacteraeota bacterium]MBV9526190.1 LysM peptidoglycan-binding domain-containing protein [Candidatus Dormibacteraeota bacterium]